MLNAISGSSRDHTEVDHNDGSQRRITTIDHRDGSKSNRLESELQPVKFANSIPPTFDTFLQVDRSKSLRVCVCLRLQLSL